MSQRYVLTPHESVEVRRHDAGCLEVEATYAPGGSPPPRHLHPVQEERFEVLAGRLRTRVGGAERELGPGDRLEISAGTVHQMWNPTPEPVRALWRTAPAGRTLAWFAALDRLQRAQRVGANGMPGPLAFAVLLTEYRDVFRLAGPDPLLRGVLAALAPLGRARGYGPAGLAGSG